MWYISLRGSLERLMYGKLSIKWEGALSIKLFKKVSDCHVQDLNRSCKLCCENLIVKLAEFFSSSSGTTRLFQVAHLANILIHHNELNIELEG